MKTKFITKTAKELKIGDSYSIKKIITKADDAKFADISLDFNPVHSDEEFAKNSVFKKTIAHGMHVSSLFSAIFGCYLPGVGSIYMSQEIIFKKPVYFGDEITATAELVELIDKEKFHIAVFKTTCVNQDGIIVVEGTAKIMPPK